MEIIAEIANTHEGSKMKAVRIANLAIDAGADAVKFQMYTANDLLIKNHSRYSHFKKQSFSLEDWKWIFKKINRKKIKIYLDIFGEESLKMSKNFQIDGYKLHISDLLNSILITKLVKTGKDIFIGTGGARLHEINSALKLIKSLTNLNQKIILLHGFQAYPTKISESNINRIQSFKKSYKNSIYYGLSDHISGDDEFSQILPLMCIPLGIKYIEKHITDNRKNMGIDYYSSLDPDDFSSFVQKVKKAQKSIGNDYEFSESEINYRNNVLKKWVFKNNLKKGHQLTEHDIVMKRDDSNIASLKINEIIGKRLIKDVNKDYLITKNLFKNKVLAIVVARSKSSRLANKATLPITDEPAISHLLNRVILCKEQKIINQIAFCTTTNDEDNILVKIVENFKSVKIYRGETENVLKRMSLAFRNICPDIIVRITGDDLLIDPEYLKKTIDYHTVNNLNYTSAKKLPTGTDTEIIDTHVLNTILQHAEDLNGTEYLTNYIVDNSNIFNVGSLPIPSKHSKSYRLTLDTKEDYEVIKKLLAWFQKNNKKYTYNLDDIIGFFEKNPKLQTINKMITQRKIPKKFSTVIKI